MRGKSYFAPVSSVVENTLHRHLESIERQFSPHIVNGNLCTIGNTNKCSYRRAVKKSQLKSHYITGLAIK